MISAFIITKNEEKNIRRALESIKWVDEIIIVDGYSTDRTVEIAKEYNAKMILSKYEGHDKEKNKAIDACQYQWIIEIDADEELTKEAEREMRIIISSYQEKIGYELIRAENFLGKTLIRAPKIRLYKNGECKYEGYTHERLLINGEIGKLKTKIIHHNNESVDEVLEYTKTLTTKEVDRIIRSGKKYTKIGILLRMIYRNIYIFFMYYLYFGLIFKGYEGLYYTLLGCSHETAIYVKYYERVYHDK